MTLSREDRKEGGKIRLAQIPCLGLCLLVFVSTVCLSAPVAAREVQSHGLLFEKWLRDTFFGSYQPKGYTQKWDIPAEANPDHGRIPVNPKAIKYGNPIDFGDALRQFEIAENGERFLLIVGFWEQASPVSKRWVNAQTVIVQPQVWRKLWQPITKADLDKLNAVVKDKSLSLEQARERAKAIKSRPPFTQAIMQVNPKIDKSQRRLQCSIRFDAFFTHLARNAPPEKTEVPKIFGVSVPRSFASEPRTIAPERR